MPQGDVAVTPRSVPHFDVAGTPHRPPPAGTLSRRAGNPHSAPHTNTAITTRSVLQVGDAGTPHRIPQCNTYGLDFEQSSTARYSLSDFLQMDDSDSDWTPGDY